MSELSLSVSLDSFSARQGGSATAGIWVTIGGQDFPAQGWDDFVVVILGWWASALVRLLRGLSQREMVDFMDGPFTVEAEIRSETLLLWGREGARREAVRCTAEGPALPFVSAVLAESERVLLACRESGWWSRDADALERATAELRAETSQLVSGAPEPERND